MPVRISKNRVALENIPLNLAAEVDVASGATTNIGAALSNNVRITGTTTITAFDTVSAGIIRFIRFSEVLTLTHNATTLKLPGAANITTATDDRAIARSFGSGNWEIFNYQKASGEAVVGSGNAYNLTNIVYPRADGDWRGIYRGGWRPSFFNQQWGGAQWGNGPDGSLTDFASGAIPVNAGNAVASAAGLTYVSQGFKVSEALSVSAIWVKIYKVGNPTNNLEMYIYPDAGSGVKPTGSTPVTNGTATAQNGKLHTANTDGAWVRFVFPTPPALTANTYYHIVLKSSGAVDASNYWKWMATNATGSYPHGNYAQGDATPTWSESTTGDGCFLIENSSTTRFLQPSGQFSGKLVFNEGSPLNQSKGLSNSLKNFFDGYEFTYRGVFTTLTKDKTVADFIYGLDHDRVVLRCNVTTGYMQVDVYESDGTKHTVTGTTDCSSGTKDIAIYIRAKGDGSDAVKLYVNGASEGTPISSATITFSTEFRDLGTAWIGGGFPIAPTWTKDTAMGSLPSADGWTWTGTGTEANCMSVSGGKLYQNKNGFGAAERGYYSRTTSFSNTNGWNVVFKVRLPTGILGGFEMRISDGTKWVQVSLTPDYITTAQLSTNPKVQARLDDREHVFIAVGKGSDFFLFMDGKLIIDGTGLFTATTASNSILFGDIDLTSGNNADVVWDYVKDYNTAWLSPQFTAGSLSEAAFFSGDRTSILASLYNGGTLKSVREFCGVEREYVEEIIESLNVKGITSNPSTTSSTTVLIPEMETFVIGSLLKISTNQLLRDTTATAQVVVSDYVDGVVEKYVNIQCPAADVPYEASIDSFRVAPLGLHKAELRWATNAGTLSSQTANAPITTPPSTVRNLSVETKI